MLLHRVLWGSTSLLLFSTVLSSFFHFNTLSQDSFAQLCPVPLTNRDQRLLVLVPHPDDETLAAGGYLYMCCQARASIRIILVSDGNRRGKRDQRYREFAAATRKLGIANSDLRFWGYPDGQLSQYQDKIGQDLEQEIYIYHPDMIIYPHPSDRHQDHAILGQIAEQVLAGSDDLNTTAYAYLVHFKYFPEPAILSRQHYLMPPRAVAGDNEEWEKIDLSAEARQAKYMALVEYRSQISNPFLLPLFASLWRQNELMTHRLIDKQP